MTAADIKVQVTDGNMLSISGERRNESEERTEKMHRVERSYGKFSRSFALPSDADASKVRGPCHAYVVPIPCILAGQRAINADDADGRCARRSTAASSW